MSRPPLSDDDLKALYREESRGEPTPMVDHLIRLAARAEVAGPVRRGPPWWHRWLAPLSLVAMAVLGLSISVRVADDDERRLIEERRSVAPEASPATAPAAATGDQALPQAPAASQRLPKLPSPSVPAPARDAARVVSGEPARSSAPAAGASATGRPGAPPAVAPAGTQAMPAASVPPAQAESANGVAELAERKAAAAAAAPAAAERMATPARESGFRAPLVADTPAPLALPSAPTAGQPAPAAKARARADAAALPEAATAEPPTPAAWVAEIRALRAAGREVEARRSLQRLRERHPGFVLPEDLR